MDLLGMLEEPARRASLEARPRGALTRAGMLGVESPQRMLAIVQAIREYGSFGAAPRISALRHGNWPAITDERGQITYQQLDDDTNRFADALIEKGLKAGDSIGILCRNHRWPLIA